MKRLLPMLAAAALPLAAQCVMCFRTAAAQQEARAHVLNTGILVLGAPPFLILAGFCFLAYKRSRRFNDEDSQRNVSTTLPPRLE